MPTAMIREDLHYTSDCLGCKIGLVLYFLTGECEQSTHLRYCHRVKQRGRSEGQLSSYMVFQLVKVRAVFKYLAPVALDAG